MNFRSFKNLAFDSRYYRIAIQNLNKRRATARKPRDAACFCYAHCLLVIGFSVRKVKAKDNRLSLVKAVIIALAVIYRLKAE